MKVKVKIRLLGTNNFGEILPTELVSILKFTVIVSFLLNRIICQMDKLIGNIVEGVLTTARSNVAILIAIAFQTAIYTC